MILLRINSNGIDLLAGEVLSEAKLLLTEMQPKNMEKRGKMIFFIFLVTLLLEKLFRVEIGIL